MLHLSLDKSHTLPGEKLLKCANFELKVPTSFRDKLLIHIKNIRFSFCTELHL